MAPSTENAPGLKESTPGTEDRDNPKKEVDDTAFSVAGACTKSTHQHITVFPVQVNVSPTRSRRTLIAAWKSRPLEPSDALDIAVSGLTHEGLTFSTTVERYGLPAGNHHLLQPHVSNGISLLSSEEVEDWERGWEDAVGLLAICVRVSLKNTKRSAQHAQSLLNRGIRLLHQKKQTVTLSNVASFATEEATKVVALLALVYRQGNRKPPAALAFGAFVLAGTKNSTLNALIRAVERLRVPVWLYSIILPDPTSAQFFSSFDRLQDDLGPGGAGVTLFLNLLGGEYSEFSLKSYPLVACYLHCLIALKTFKRSVLHIRCEVSPQSAMRAARTAYYFTVMHSAMLFQPKAITIGSVVLKANVSSSVLAERDYGELAKEVRNLRGYTWLAGALALQSTRTLETAQNTDPKRYMGMTTEGFESLWKSVLLCREGQRRFVKGELGFTLQGLLGLSQDGTQDTQEPPTTDDYENDISDVKILLEQLSSFGKTE